MRIKNEVLILLVLIAHLLLLSFTHFSFVGFWIDTLTPIILISSFLFFFFKERLLKKLIVGISLWYIILGVISINKIGFWNLLSSKNISSFYWKKENDRIFNAYFQPVGAYSGGEGNFWITESPIYFPVIEYTTYYKHAILWDFGLDEFDGRSVNQDEIVRSYIRQEVIK